MRLWNEDYREGKEVLRLKILAVIGSPRINGNTCKLVNLIEKELKARDKEIEFEYVQLCRVNLQPCKGCYVCIEKGEREMPVKG